MGVFLLVVGLFLFIMLVVLHELGHFLVARRNGIEVEEFGIFFPPRLWKRKMKSGYVFSINLLPLGGFVKLKGEHDADREKGSFGAASMKAKTKVMLAGVGVNLIIALVLFTALAWLGMPQLGINNQFTVKSDTRYIERAQITVVADSVDADSPASHAGLKTGDTLLAIGPAGHLQAITDANGLPAITHKYGGKTIQLKYRHDGKIYQKPVTLHTAAEIAAAQKKGKSIGYLGVEADQNQKGLTLTRSTWSAPVVAVGLSVQLTALTFQGLGHALAGLGGIFAGLFTGNHAARESAQTAASSQVSGPVGIFEILKQGSALGYRFMLMIVAIISLTLAIMNVLPIPALDGGRLYVLLGARAFGKQISQKAEEAIYGASFAVLMVLIIVITVVDVKRF